MNMRKMILAAYPHRRPGMKYGFVLPLILLLLFSSCAGLKTRPGPQSLMPGHKQPAALTSAASEELPLWQPLPDSEFEKIFPYALTYDPNTGVLFFTDIVSNRVCFRRADGTFGIVTASLSLQLSLPLALECIGSTTLLVADTDKKRISAIMREGIAPDFILSNGRITGLAVGPDQSVYYSDYDACNVVRAASDGTQTIVAGTSAPGFAGDGGDAKAAMLNGPYGLAVSNNRLFIADSLNHRIRVLDLATNQIQTFAGNGVRGKEIPASPVSGLDVALNEPRDVVTDAQGNVYVINTFGPSILCFDSGGQFIPAMVKATFSENARPACGVVVDGNLVYTDLVTPQLLQSPIAAAVPQPPPPPPAPPAEAAPAQPAAATEPPPPPPAPTPETIPVPVSTPPPAAPAAPAPPAYTPPGTTTLKLVGPTCIAGMQSASYRLVLDLAANDRLAAVVAQVRFDPQQMQIRFAVPQPGSPPETRQAHVSQEQGVVTFSMHTRAGSAPPSGMIELCELLFECVADKQTPTVIRFEVPAPTAISVDGVPVATTSQNLEVLNFLYGDVSRDNKVDLMDALLLLHHGEQSEELPDREAPPSDSLLLIGDVDRDGTITLSDSLAVIRLAYNGPALPTAPPRAKSAWTDKDILLQNALVQIPDGTDTLGLTAKPDPEKTALKTEWTTKLSTTGSVLFVNVPKFVRQNQRELLLDVILGLPDGVRLGAFRTEIDFDPQCVAVQKVLIDDQGPQAILGKSEVSEGRVSLEGVCRFPGDATDTVVRLAGLLVTLTPPEDGADWDTRFAPTVTELLDHDGKASFGFGVPTVLRSYEPGDLTRDGSVDSLDLVLLCECLTGTSSFDDLRSKSAADLDDDGEYTIRDAAVLSALIKGTNLFDPLTPTGKQIVVRHVIDRLFTVPPVEESGLLPPMIDLLTQSTAGLTLDAAVKDHGIFELEGPFTPGKGGFFLFALKYRPYPGSSLGGYQLAVECNPALISIQTVLPAASMESAGKPLISNITENRGRVLLTQLPDWKPAEGTSELLLASILCQMKADADVAPVSATFRLVSYGAVDQQGEHVKTICPSYTVSNYLPGDVNRDGSVERLDEALLTRYVIGEISMEDFANPDAADLNLDGKIDMTDIVLVEQATLGDVGYDALRRARRDEALKKELKTQ
ncbi:MAG TPA: dockerin type I domain-containing protein [bacterium]|nr:dockerin type I domain-containing protein [bacterium]HQL62416.1 dockerin type I domain-containing protein [bacterium]